MRLAALVGTIQSAMTDFHDIKPAFKENSEEERLLGVSISGIMDCPIISGGNKKVLNHLRDLVISENKKWAKKLGINASTSTTCVKPDGNTSVLYDTSPGVHGRYAPYYIRRLQLQAGTPVANFALAAGIPAEPIVGESWENLKTLVISFPVKSPDGAVIQRERSAVEQLENWLAFKKEYTETNPSVTIMYRPDELPAMAAWLHKHQKHVVGLSFLPADDHTYQQTPYEEITEAEYERLVADFPEVDLDSFWQWEVSEDTTDAAKVMSCTGGACLI
jgi:ribonucleoside-diphosphate reductase alpha chain